MHRMWMSTQPLCHESTITGIRLILSPLRPTPPSEARPHISLMCGTLCLVSLLDFLSVYCH